MFYSVCRFLELKTWELSEKTKYKCMSNSTHLISVVVPGKKTIKMILFNFIIKKLVFKALGFIAFPYSRWYLLATYPSHWLAAMHEEPIKIGVNEDNENPIKW